MYTPYVCIHPMYVCIHTYIGLLRYNPDVEEPVMLIQACELSAFGFFQRGNVCMNVCMYVCM